MAETRTDVAVRLATVLKDNPDEIPFVLGFLVDGVTLRQLRSLETQVNQRIDPDAD